MTVGRGWDKEKLWMGVMRNSYSLFACCMYVVEMLCNVDMCMWTITWIWCKCRCEEIFDGNKHADIIFSFARVQWKRFLFFVYFFFLAEKHHFQHTQNHTAIWFISLNRRLVSSKHFAKSIGLLQPQSVDMLRIRVQRPLRCVAGWSHTQAWENYSTESKWILQPESKHWKCSISNGDVYMCRYSMRFGWCNHH